MARSFTITQEGESRRFTIETGVGPTGPSGVAPPGTGLVSVTSGVLDTPATLSARVASDASNLRNQLGLGTAATKDTSTGGNAAADAGKVVEFDSGGGVTVAVTGPRYAFVSTGGYGISGQGSPGVSGNSSGGIGVYATSGTGTALHAVTDSGTYNARFGLSGDNQSFVALVNGAFGWFRGIFTGRIQAATTLTAERIWTLPDKTGTVAMTSDITGTNSGTNTGDNSPNTSSATAAQGTLATNSVQLTGNQTIAGDKAFASTTRPTSSGTGTPAATSLITLADNDERLIAPSVLLMVDDFNSGHNDTDGSIGDLGWHKFGSGSFVITSPNALQPGENPGQKTITTGALLNNTGTMYLSGGRNFFSRLKTNWESVWVFKLGQTTDCDMIAGFTNSGNIGVGVSGGTSIGVRYTSTVDTNFMFYSKQTDSDWAPNDASNFAISSGVPVDTNFHTVRMRSVALDVMDMKIDAGAWITVSNITGTSFSMFPFFYVSTRTTAAKNATIDYFAFRQTGLLR